ncbi:hypothetical protein FHC77_08200 [Atlantibacter hermannii]|uniref:hypothetical protein n=1 Tax=Atlantibacter hermannii TaxID=565 RepID=UPI001C703004|nr:hypothetical protein [Atlantibacter hermannii]MBW9430726.1 hypothetical protein [Atlantibacter hermannii]
MDKLSELSKPVAWAHRPDINAPIDVTENAYVASNWRDFHGRDVQPHYSQEYVSALLARIANLEFEQGGYGYSVLEDLNGKIKRIAELERDVAAAKCDDELWDAMAHRLKTLEDRLATPVRLPELCGDGENDTEYTEGLNDGINQSAKAVRAAGFTVEGDE